GELEIAAKDLFEKKKLGRAGSTALLEEGLVGWELSYFVITNGSKWAALPVAQDHKRLLDGDLGPNTGGMGAVAPLRLEENLKSRIEKEIVQPTVDRLNLEGTVYRGVLFIGVMCTPDGPKVLEYNVRFGDPETQVLMPLLNGDWAQVFLEIAKGEVPDLNWRDVYSAVVVLAAEGYPDQPVKGAPISGDLLMSNKNSYVLSAGVRFDPREGWLTNGGRVLNSVGLGDSLEDALNNAYSNVEKISWPGIQYRKDIGSKQIK
ncbi:MAG: phosphoribosylamine--glycine ligase, partial [Bdellovibrionales bacterium]|nr:phosphoribosylamine--glycine ligase [Bdellovibrionales bacterium]